MADTTNNITYTSPGAEDDTANFSENCRKAMDYLIMRQEAYDALKSLGKQRGFDIDGDDTAVVPISLNHLDGMKVPTIMRGIW